MKRGKFIVIEGGEGAGKGVVLRRLRDFFGSNKEVVFTREPGGTVVAEKIRNVLMDKENKNTTPLTELFLFSAARAQHIGELVKPSLEGGINVISDRFDPSTIAYQLHGRDKRSYDGVFKILNEIAVSGVKPDAVIYLDVEPEVGLSRKKNSDDGHCTRFDEEELDFHRRVRDGYIFQYREAVKSRSNPVWYLVPTTNMKEEEVKATVLVTVLEIINLSLNEKK